MYVVPNMRWEGWILDNSAPAAPPFELTPDGNTSFGSWLGYVHIWGQAVDVRAFAESFFESNPSIRGLRIKIEERHLRPGCNLIGSRVLYWDIVRNDDDQITIWPSRDDTWVDFIPAESVLLSD